MTNKMIDTPTVRSLRSHNRNFDMAGPWRYVTDEPIVRMDQYEEMYMVLRHEDGTFWGVEFREPFDWCNWYSGYPWDDDDAIELVSLTRREVVRVEYIHN